LGVSTEPLLLNGRASLPLSIAWGDTAWPVVLSLDHAPVQLCI